MQELSTKSIVSMLETKDYQSIKLFFDYYSNVSLAEIMEELTDSQIILIFKLLPTETSADIFSYLSSELQEKIVDKITGEDLTLLTSDLQLDDFTDIVSELPSNLVRKILNATSKEKRELINRFLNYEEDTAGSLMTVEYIEIKEQFSVNEALDYIKVHGLKAQTISICYVVDSTRNLVGSVPFKDLFFSEASVPVRELMQSDPVSVVVSDHKEMVADIFKKYDITSLPVISSEKKMQGVITVDDIIDVIEEVASEDFQQMEGISPLEEPYLETSFFKMYQKRIFWLSILMISAIFTSGIIKSFENQMAVVPILAAYIPMLMDTGGNSAGQSSSLVIRGIALKEIGIGNIFKVLKKELLVGFLAGVTLAVLNFGLVTVQNLISGTLFSEGLTTTLVISLTLFVIVIIAKLIGGSLPLLAKCLKLDPAVMVGPLITTIIDALALLCYFGLATLLISSI